MSHWSAILAVLLLLLVCTSNAFKIRDKCGSIDAHSLSNYEAAKVLDDFFRKNSELNARFPVTKDQIDEIVKHGKDLVHLAPIIESIIFEGAVTVVSYCYEVEAKRILYQKETFTKSSPEITMKNLMLPLLETIEDVLNENNYDLCYDDRRLKTISNSVTKIENNMKMNILWKEKVADFKKQASLFQSGTVVMGPFSIVCALYTSIKATLGPLGFAATAIEVILTAYGAYRLQQNKEKYQETLSTLEKMSTVSYNTITVLTHFQTDIKTGCKLGFENVLWNDPIKALPRRETFLQMNFDMMMSKEALPSMEAILKVMHAKRDMKDFCRNGDVLTTLTDLITKIKRFTQNRISPKKQEIEELEKYSKSNQVRTVGVGVGTIGYSIYASLEARLSPIRISAATVVAGGSVFGDYFFQKRIHKHGETLLLLKKLSKTSENAISVLKDIQKGCHLGFEQVQWDKFNDRVKTLKHEINQY